MLLTKLVIYSLPTLVSSVIIQSGTSALKGASDSCGSRQEFECTNNICDAAVKAANVPGATCNFNDGGKRCLESNIGAAGYHATPDENKDQGTSKHFSCLTVDNFDTPVIIWETSDCNGNSCFIPSSGAFATWKLGAQANCVEIAPTAAIVTVPCLSPGENGNLPPNGGFPADLSLPVGGDAGLPASYNNTNTCNAAPSTATTPSADDIPNPPIADFDTAYFSPYDNTADQGTIDKRAGTEPTPKIVTAVAALKQINYRGIYSTVVRPWIFLQEQAQLATYLGFISKRLDVDHIVEIETVVAYFTSDWQNTLGLTQNQWDIIRSFIDSQGLIWGLDASPQTCHAYQDFRELLSNPANLRGVDNTVNLLKNVVFGSLLPTLLPLSDPARTTPHWRTSWTRKTAAGTLAYLQLVQPYVPNVASSFGNFLDWLVTPPDTQAVNNLSFHFAQFIQTLWEDAVALLQGVLAQPVGYFLGE